MYCAQKENKNCFKDFTLFSTSLPHFANMTHRKLSDKKNVIQLCNWCIHSTKVPSMDNILTIKEPYA
jgi:hypothetical protein